MRIRGFRHDRAVVFLFSGVVSLIRPGPVSSPRAFAKQSSLRSNLLIWNDLCLTNCYFAHDSSGFPILLLFFDAQSGRSCYPLDRHAGPVARTWWRPFPGRGVASPETPAPDRICPQRQAVHIWIQLGPGLSVATKLEFGQLLRVP